MIMNDVGANGWGPTTTLSPADTRCKIPSLSNTSVMRDIPSYPLIGVGPLGLTTVQTFLSNDSAVRAAAEPVRRCIHMNPKLAEFDSDGVPGVMWAYLWSIQPAHGCYLPDGTTYLPAGYYAYRNDQSSDHGWQLDVSQGKAEINQTRGQAIKKVWGRAHQTSFIYSCWDLPPLDSPPSTIFRVDTTDTTPRKGTPFLQCYGTSDGNKVHLGEATGNDTDLFFLVDFDDQVAHSDVVGETFSADIYYAYRGGDTDARGQVPVPPDWGQSVKTDDDTTASSVRVATAELRARTSVVEEHCTCDVVDEYGAVGDGLVDDTAALQRAFDGCGLTSGCAVRVVVLPAGGRFLSFPLVLSNALRVEVMANASLLASPGRVYWPLRSEPMYHSGDKCVPK